MRAVWQVAAVLGALSWTAVGSAQSAPDLARAQQLFDEGDKAEQAGDCTTALGKFQAAMSVVETPQLRLRAGRCEEKLGRLVDALSDYERASVLAQNDRDLYSVSQDKIAALKPRVPKLVFELPATLPSILSITVDGTVIANPAAPWSVNPGSHRVQASAPGYDKFEQKVEAREGASTTVRIVLVPGQPAPQVTKPEQKSGGGVDPIPWILIGGGVAFLGASVGLGVKSFLLKDDAAQEAEANDCVASGYSVECPASLEGTEIGQRFEDMESEQRLFVGLTMGGAVIAGGLLITGVVLSATSGSTARPASTGLKAAAPWVAKDGFGVIVAGAF